MSKRPTPKITPLEKVQAEQAQRELDREKEAEAEREAMLEQAKVDFEVLGFDYDDISWDDANEFVDITTREFVAAEDGDREALEEARHEMRVFLARVVTDVPDSWFVSSVNGDAKDFSDPDIYRRVKATKARRLVAALNYGLEEASKN